MKRIFLASLIAIAMTPAMAQTFPNGGMETWHDYSSGATAFTAISLERPNSWFGSDSLAVYFAQLVDFSSGKFGASYSKQLTKTTDKYSGTYAAKLQTVKQGDSLVLPCVMSNAQMNVNLTALASGDYASAFSFHGGTPVVSRVTDVMAYVKYETIVPLDTSGADSGRIVVEALRHDTLIGAGQMSIGIMPDYTLADVKISYLDTSSVPDTIVVSFFSSSAHFRAGSTLFVDDVTMGVLAVPGTPIAPQALIYPNPNNGVFTVQLPQGSIEKWAVYGMDGRLAASKTITGTELIDLSTLPEGVYFYTGTDSQGALATKGELVIKK